MPEVGRALCVCVCVCARVCVCIMYYVCCMCVFFSLFYSFPLSLSLGYGFRAWCLICTHKKSVPNSVCMWLFEMEFLFLDFVSVTYLFIYFWFLHLHPFLVQKQQPKSEWEMAGCSKKRFGDFFTYVLFFLRIRFLQFSQCMCDFPCKLSPSSLIELICHFQEVFWCHWRRFSSLTLFVSYRFCNLGTFMGVLFFSSFGNPTISHFPIQCFVGSM